MMSDKDIRHWHISSNFVTLEMKGNCAPISDAPNLQPLIYDVAVETQAHPAREAVIKMPLHGGTTVWGEY